MANWFSRLLKPASAPPAARPATTAAAPSAVSPTDEAPPTHDFALRRALVDRQGRRAGFEFTARLTRRAEADTAAAAGHGAASSVAQAAALVAAARLAAGAAGGGRSLVVMPGPWLDRPGVQAAAGPGVMLAWRDAGPAPSAASAAALHARGALLGAPDGPPQALPPGVDFVLLQGRGGDTDTLLRSAQRWHEQRPRLPLVATGLGAVDEIELVLQRGITLAGGRFDGRGAAPAPRPLDAALHRICELMNQLALDRDTAEVADTLRADVALSYRLLRWANSPALGLSRGVETVEQAVTLLGRTELHRWLSVLLLSAAKGRPAAAAMQEHALARGRLFELLARARGEAAPAALFTLGMLSQLDLLLQVPMATALEPLRLSDPARQALLHAAGPWACYLAVASALEGDDDEVLARASAAFAGSTQVLEAAHAAWAWATEALAAG